jgi:hypothetical protein
VCLLRGILELSTTPVVVDGRRFPLGISATASWLRASEMVGLKELQLSVKVQPDVIATLMVCRLQYVPQSRSCWANAADSVLTAWWLVDVLARWNPHHLQAMISLAVRDAIDLCKESM